MISGGPVHQERRSSGGSSSFFFSALSINSRLNLLFILPFIYSSLLLLTLSLHPHHPSLKQVRLLRQTDMQLFSGWRESPGVLDLEFIVGTQQLRLSKYTRV